MENFSDTAASQAAADSTSVESTSDSTPKLDLKERLVNSMNKSADKRTSAPNADSEPNAKEVEPDAKAKSDVKEDSKPSEKTDTRAEKRINQLVARTKETQSQLLAKDMELRKMQKAYELLTKEVQRFQAKAQFTPEENRAAVSQYNREAQDFVKELQAEQAELAQKAEYEERVNEVMSSLEAEVEAISDKYYLVSPEEIYMAISRTGETATEVASRLHAERAARHNKTTQVNAPKTVRVQGVGSVDPVRPGIKGDWIKDGLSRRAAERSGKF